MCSLLMDRLRPSDIAKHIAFVPQETHMVFPFTVQEIVMMGRLPHRAFGAFLDSRMDTERTIEAMALTDTVMLSGKRFNDISGGECHRVVIVSELARCPVSMIYD